MHNKDCWSRKLLVLAITNTMAAGVTNAAVIEEVVVTATKRAASLQSIPMSVTAVTGANLTEMGIDNVLDMEKTTPGLKIRDVGNNPKIILRGAGSAGTTDVAVPIYVDGLYRPRPGQGLASYLDVDRVEILRGPQGTLFGRNTLGGLMNVITNKPEMGVMDFGAAATLGDYDLRKFEGFANVPLGDRVALRIAASDTQRDPYVENVYDSAGGLKDADATYARGHVLFNISDTMDLNLGYGYWSDTANGAGDFGHKVLGIPVNPETQATNGLTGILDPRMGLRDGWEGGKAKNGSVSNGDPSAFLTGDIREIAYDYRPNRDMKEDSFTGEFNWDLGFASLRVAAGYYDFEAYNILDGDFSIAGAYTPIGTSGGWASGEQEVSESTQVDVNLTSASAGVLRWTLGYYSFSEDRTRGWIFGDTSADAPQSVSWAHWLHADETTADSQAIYGQAEYDLTDDLTLTVGARYSDDERSVVVLGVDPDSLEGTDRPRYISTPGALKAKGDDSQVDYRVALQYNINDDVMAFASVATGYISGEVQQGTGTLLDPSENEAYELGIKSTWLSGGLQVNATYYNSEYTGLTTSQLFVVPGTDVFGTRVVPGGGLDSEGLEAEIIWQATDALRITSSLTYDKSEFSEFNIAYRYSETNGNSRITVLDDGSMSMDVSGLDSPFSPDISANLGISYDISLGSLGSVTPSVFVYYSDDYETWPAPYFWTHQDSYTTVDLSVIWYSPGSTYSVQAYVNNLTDEEYITGSDTFSDSRAVVQFNDPRVWGIRAAYNF